MHRTHHRPSDFRETLEREVRRNRILADIAEDYGVSYGTFNRWLREEFPGLTPRQVRVLLGGKVLNNGDGCKHVRGKAKPAQSIPKDKLPPIEDFMRPRLAVPVRIVSAEEWEKM